MIEPGSDERTYDHIVIGAGIAGTATAFTLAGRSRRVALFEQYELDHTMGSSHGNSRIFRLAYDNPGYVRLAQQARGLWLELERAAGIDLLAPGGVIDCGPASMLNPITSALQSCGVETVELAAGEGVAKQFSMPPDWGAIFQPDGGTTWARRALEAFVRLARDHGADVLAHARVDTIEESSDGVTVRAGGRTYTAKTAVVTAGGWANRLLEPLGVKLPLKVTREHVAYYRRRDADPFLPFIWHPDNGDPQIYGLPNLADGTAKVGRHIAGSIVEAGTTGEIIPSEIDLINRFVTRHLPTLEAEPVHGETCLYASSPDDGFIMERRGHVVVGAGFGGHGFKFGPVLGEVLADMAEGKLIALDPTFAINRFASVNA